MTLYSLTEDERQTVLVALAELALARPGWTDYLAAIASNRFNGRVMFEEIVALRHCESGGKPCDSHPVLRPPRPIGIAPEQPQPETDAGATDGGA